MDTVSSSSLRVGEQIHIPFQVRLEPLSEWGSRDTRTEGRTVCNLPSHQSMRYRQFQIWMIERRQLCKDAKLKDGYHHLAIPSAVAVEHKFVL